MSCSAQQDRGRPRFAGDRYQRFSQGAHVLATDPAVAEGTYPLNSDGLLLFSAAIAERDLLNRLSERESDLVTIMVLLDFHNGPACLAARVHQWIADEHDAMAADRIWIISSALFAIVGAQCELMAASEVS